MSDSFSKLLSGLKEFTSDRIKSLDSAADEHQEWLKSVVEEAQRKIEGYVGNACGCSKSADSTKERDEQGESDISNPDARDLIHKSTNDDHDKKPRRGSRKKREVDYYDGPDNNSKRQQGSIEKQKYAKIRKNDKIQEGHNVSKKVSRKRQEEECCMHIVPVKQEKDIVLKSLEGDLSTRIMEDPPKKERLTKKKGARKAKNSKKTCVRKGSRGSDVSIKEESLANQAPPIQKNVQHDFKVVPSEPPKPNTEDFENLAMKCMDDKESEQSSPQSESRNEHVQVDHIKAPVSPGRNVLDQDTTVDLMKQASPRKSPFKSYQNPKEDNSIDRFSQPSQHEPHSACTVNDQEKTKGDDTSYVFAVNLASSVKTLLPTHDVNTSTKVLISESPEVNMKDICPQEQMEVKKLDAERLIAETREFKAKEDLQRRKEEEINERKKAKEEEERRKREEKAKRLEEHKKRRKLEAEAAARSASAGTSLLGPPSGSGGSLAAAKERLAKIQQQAAMLRNQGSTNEKHSLNSTKVSKTPKQVHQPSGNVNTPQPYVTSVASPGKRGVINLEAIVHNKSYEISPYKSDHESDDDVPKKPVPDWARGKALLAQLVAQMYVDPDEVFQQHAKTCSLDQVFGSCRKPDKQNFNRRSSSGNWIEDRVTWKEEMGYKKAMGYI